MTVPSIDDLIQQAEHKQHPYGKSRQPFGRRRCSSSSVCSNVDRRGLDKEITRLPGHDPGGLASLPVLPRHTKGPTPNSPTLKGDRPGSGLSWFMPAASAAIPVPISDTLLLIYFVMPALPSRKSMRHLKAKGQQQQAELAKPLDTDAQRVDVVGAKAEAAGVSKTTAKKVERVKNENPSAVAAIAAGKTTANKELDKLKANGKKKSSNPPAKPKHNYKHCRHTKIMVAEQTPHSPDSFLVTLKSVEPPSGSMSHDLFVSLDRKLAAKLHQQLGQSLAVKSNEDGEDSQPPSQPKSKADEAIITIRNLTSLYGSHALPVLHEYLDELPRKVTAGCEPTKSPSPCLPRLRVQGTSNDKVHFDRRCSGGECVRWPEWYKPMRGELRCISHCRGQPQQNPPASPQGGWGRPGSHCGLLRAASTFRPILT